MKKEKINLEELNGAIKTGSKVLNLFYFMLIVLLIGGITFLLKSWNILPIVLTILKVISPFFIGFIIAWLLNPLVNKLQEKGVKRSLGVAIVFLLLLVVIYLFCLAVIPTLIEQVNEMVKMIPDFLKDAREIVDKVFLKLSNTTNIDMFETKVEFIHYIENFAKGLATDLPTKVLNIVQGLLSGLGKFLIGMVIGFYLLFNFNTLGEHFTSLVPKKFRADAEHLLSSISEILSKFVNGTLLVSLMLFVISVIGFEIIGLDAAVLFAFFCAVTNIIPYVGPYIGGVPAVLVAFSQSPLIGILTLAFIVLVQGIEGNFLHPYIIGKTMDLHPVTIVISLLIFEHFFGIMGMIIATPLVAIIKIIYVFLDEKFDFFGYSKDKSVKKEISKVRLAK